MDHTIDLGMLRPSRRAASLATELFVDSEDGTLTNAVFVSRIASCEIHGIEPWAYLRDLLHLLPDWPKCRSLRAGAPTTTRGSFRRFLDMEREP